MDLLVNTLTKNGTKIFSYTGQWKEHACLQRRARSLHETPHITRRTLKSIGDLDLAALRYWDEVKAVQTAVQKDAALTNQEP